MGSRFENFAIGRAVAKFLNVKDPKNFPLHLNTDQLQPVINIPGISIPDTQLTGDFQNQTIAANTNALYTLVGPEQYTSGAGTIVGTVSPIRFSKADDQEVWVRAMRLAMTLDAAGAAAANNRKVNVVAWIGDSRINNSLGYIIQEAAFIIQTGRLDYIWAWPQSSRRYDTPAAYAQLQMFTGPGWNGYVPPGMFMTIAVQDDSGSNFPANTTLSGQWALSYSQPGVLSNGR